jgi:hypothetical protein
MGEQAVSQPTSILLPKELIFIQLMFEYILNKIAKIESPRVGFELRTLW